MVLKFLDKLKGKRPPVRPVQQLLLDVDEANMRRVYTLSEELAADPNQKKLVHALTLNSAKPLMGLKGTHGLFASPQWWDNINYRRMPLRFVSGVILRAYEAGQDSKTGFNNSVSLRLTDGRTEEFGIYANRKEDTRLFREGQTVQMVLALDELKRPTALGKPGFSDITLEVAVSIV